MMYPVTCRQCRAIETSKLRGSNSLEEAWNNVVRYISIYEACSITVNEPAGNVFTILHIPAEVLLPVSTEKRGNSIVTCVYEIKTLQVFVVYLYISTLWNTFTWSRWVFVLSHTWWHLVSLVLHLDAGLSLQTQPHGRIDLEEHSSLYIDATWLTEVYFYISAAPWWTLVTSSYLRGHEQLRTCGGCPVCRNPGSLVDSDVSSTLLCVGRP